MRQYCSVCKGHYDMTVVRESVEDGVIWLKCPHCQGILPHMPESDGGGGTATAPAPVPAVAPARSTEADPLEDIDVEAARPYEPTETYQVGDVVHHRGWNDFGVVIAKQDLPGNRAAIRVRFVESGEVQLIEGGA